MRPPSRLRDMAHFDLSFDAWIAHAHVIASSGLCLMCSTRRLAHLFSSFSQMVSHMICAGSPRLSRGSCGAFDGSLACRAPSPRSLAHVLRVARVVSASPVTRLTWRFRWLARALFSCFSDHSRGAFEGWLA